MERNKKARIMALVSFVLLLTLSSSQFFPKTRASSSDFGTNIRIDDTGASMILQGRPVASSYGNYVYSAWQDGREGQTKIHFARSIDLGISFQENIRVDDSPDSALALEPSIAVNSSGTVFVAWADDRDGSGSQIFLAGSTNEGISFKGGSRANASIGTHQFHEPSVAASEGKVGIAWVDYDTPHIYYAESTDMGTSFEPTKKVSDDGCASAFSPDLVINETGSAFVVWESYATTTWMICFSRFLSDGSPFSPSIWVSDDPTTTGQRMPSIALTSNGTIVVIWRDYRSGGYYEILMSMSFDGGGNFTAPMRVDDYSGPEWKLWPSLSITPGGNVYVAWLDQRGGSLDLYVTNSSAENVSFGQSRKVNDGGGLSFVATPSNDIHASNVGTFLVWQDDRRGDWDIYFARSPPLQRSPLPPTSLRTIVNDTFNVRLDWVASESPNVTHYQIYRSEDQTDFDFSTPAYDTSLDIDPLRTNWTDLGAANSTAPSEYYYVVQAVNEQGLKSITSNTAGKWTKQLNIGLNAFSLPLEPFEETNISWYADNIPNATYVRWMNPLGRWVTHYKGSGEGIQDTAAEIGQAYEIYLENTSTFTFCGFPGSMIRFAEGRVGDSLSFRRGLNVTVQNDDIVLNWPSIASISGYHVFMSNIRNGLHNLSLEPVAKLNSSTTTWRDANVLGKGGEYYYMIIPVNLTGGLGSSTYGMGVFVRNYSGESDTFSLPLKSRTQQSIDWYCGNIPSTVGIAYMISGVWKFHAIQMPAGVYDVEVLQGDGYQISIDGSATRFAFIGY